MVKRQEEIVTEKKEPGIFQRIGPWAFVLGLVVAALAAITQNVFWMLGILGAVVGLLNITDREITLYLIASLTFLMSANALSVTLTKLVGFVPFIGAWMVYIDPLLANITLFVAPGAAIVALKALYSISRN